MSENYLIEIVAQLRDEASNKIRDLQRAVDELKASAASGNATGKLTEGLADTADEAERAAQAHKDLNRQQQETGRTARQAEGDVRRSAGQHEQAARAVHKHAASHENLAGNVEDTADSVDALAKKLSGAEDAMKRVQQGASALGGETKTLEKQVDGALESFDALSKSWRDGSGDLKQLRQDLQASGKELDGLSRRFETFDHNAQMLRNLSEEAQSMSKSLDTLQSSSRQPILNNLGIDKAKQDLSSLTREFEKFNREVANSQSEESRLTNRLFASRFGAAARVLPMGTEAFQSAIGQQSRAQSLSRVVREAKPPRDFVAEGNQMLAQMSKLDAAARSHTASNAELTAGYSKLASGLRRVWSEMDVGSASARKFGDAMEDAGKKAKNLDLARASSGIGKFAQQVASATDSIHIKIISLSAALRGARLAAFIGLFQPIITGLVSFAAGLFNVASGATQAGAALGGVFLSGLGQMIPMLSIAVAALIRFRDVLQAVQAAQAEKQAAFFQPFQGLINQLQNANQLIEAEQSLANAYYTLQDAQVQVKESQIQLTQARIDAIRNLQDLVIAERSAQLELKNANMSVVNARQSLAAAEATGSQNAIQQAQLQLQGAELQRQQAQLGVPRSRQNLQIALRYGVTGSPEVLSANEAYRQSLLGVTRAQQGIASAERQMKITRLQLAQPASHMTSQQATLQYLLGQMSPVEKTLFNQLNSLESQLRSPNSPLKKITDDLLQPFTYAFSRLDTLLHNKSFLGPITDLAKAMGGGIRSIFQTMFGPRGTSFFETMAKDATTSIPIVTKAITGLMKVFEDLATAAAPAFNRLSKDWAKFWNALDSKDRTAAGQKRLEAFFNRGAKWAEDFAKLAGAIYDLFKALGRDAAPQGMKTVTSFTEAIHDATDWVNTHGREVTNFFSQARQGLSLLGGILFQIGKQLLQVFSLESLKAFATLLTSVVLPAARMLADALGFVVTKFTELLNKVGPLKEIVVGLATAFLGLLVLNRFISVATKATNVVSGFYEALKAFRNADGFLSGLSAAWEALTGRISKGTKALDAAKTAQAELNTVTAESGVAGDVGTGGLILPAGVARTAGITTAEEAGGAGILGTLGVGGIAGAAALPLALGGGAILLALNTGGPTKGTAVGGLGSLLGRVGGTHRDKNILDRLNPFDGTGFLGLGAAVSANQSTQTTNALKGLQTGLQNITNPAQLSAQQLQSMWEKAQRILQMPDITAKQRQGLQQLVNILNPSTVALQKLQAQWTATFQGINATTGSVMQQVQQVLAQDIQNISINLGTGTKQGASALQATISAAWQSVINNTSAAERATNKGISMINQMLVSALKAYGVHIPKALSQGLAANVGKGRLSLPQAVATGSAISAGLPNASAIPANATGGWHSSRPGGQIVQVGEGGHDEVTLSTDPRYASNSRSLLNRFFARAPHLAAGGFVPDPGTNFSVGYEPRIVSALRDLADKLHVTIYGISGYRSPTHSVSVGGFDDDPHTKAAAADIGVNSRLRVSAARLTNAMLASVGLYRPFDPSDDPNNPEVNHVQLLGVDVNSLPIITNVRNAATFAASSISSASGPVTAAAAALQQLVAPTVTGVAGALGSLSQGVVNQATAAANQYLAGFGGSTGAVGAVPYTGATGSAQARAWTARAMRLAGVSGSLWTNLLLRQESRESTFNPNAINRTDINAQEGHPSQGILQLIPSNFARYALPGFNSNILDPISNIIAAIRYMIATYGHGNPSVAAQVMWARGGGAYASGGILGGRASWGGRPVPIVAHEGERVSNPMQWAEVARMAGTTPSGLDRHLGFTGSPRQHFAAGGKIGMAGNALLHLISVLLPQLQALTYTRSAGQGYTSYPAVGSLGQVNSFLGNITGNLFKMDPGSLFGAFGSLSHLLQAITNGIGDIAKLPIKQQTDKLTTIVENFADPNNPDSTLNLLAAAFQRFQNNISAWVTSLGYRVKNVSPGGIAQVHGGVLQGTGFGGVSLGGPELNAGNIGHTGQTTIDALGVRASVEQTQYLQRETKSIATAIQGVRSRMRTVRNAKLSSKTKNAALTKLQGAYTELVQQQENLNSSINNQISTTFEDEQTYIQDTLNQVNDVYQTQQEAIQGQQSIAQAKGQYGELKGIDQALINSAAAQIQALQAPLQEAQKSGNADLVAEIQQQIIQLQQTIGETTAQMIQDSMSAIQQAGQTSQARVSMLQTISQTMQQSAGSAGGIAAAFGLNAQALNLNQSSLQQQLQGYNSLLGQAIATGNQGAVATLTQTIDQLTAQLAQNAQALQDNTAQMIAAESQFTQARGQFQTGTLSGLAQVVQTVGQTTGFTNVPLLQALTQGQNNVLGGTQTQLLGQLSQLGGGASGLASALMGAGSNPMLFAQLLGGANLSGIESDQDATWINTFESLIGNLTQNTEAIAQNNQQLAQLNGMLTQPQQWSTTTWQAFRNAIFSGMGNLLPQFQSTLTGSAIPTIAPIFSAVGRGGSMAHIENLNINHAPTPNFEPRVLGEQMAYEVSNAI